MKLIKWGERKIQKMTFWDMALTKFVLIFFGLIVGAYISSFIKQYIWLFIILWIAGYITLIYNLFIKK